MGSRFRISGVSYSWEHTVYDGRTSLDHWQTALKIFSENCFSLGEIEEETLHGKDHSNLSKRVLATILVKIC